MYEEVYIVEWNNSTCSADLNLKGEFPSSFTFDIGAASSKEALTFYSRHHIEHVKLTELIDATNATFNIATRVKNGESICCKDSGEGSCLGKQIDVFRTCDKEDFNTEDERFNTLEDSVIGWVNTIDQANKNTESIIADKNKSVVNWFDTVGSEDMYTKEDKDGKPGEDGRLKIDNFKAHLAPLTLIDVAESINDDLSLDLKKKAKEKIKNSNRIQFSGMSGTYEMTLNKAKSKSNTEQDCTQNKAVQWMTSFLGDPFTGITTGLMTGFAAISHTRNFVGAVDRINKKIELEAEKIRKREGARRNWAHVQKGMAERKRDGISNDRAKENQAIAGDLKEAEKTEAKRESQVKKSIREYEEKTARLKKQADEDKKSPAEKRKDRENQKKDEEEKRNKKRDDERMKDKKQSKAAQSVGRGQVKDFTKGKSVVPGSLKKFSLPFTGAPLLISSALAGCNYEMETEAEPGEIEFALAFMNIGVEAGIGGGK